MIRTVAVCLAIAVGAGTAFAAGTESSAQQKSAVSTDQSASQQFSEGVVRKVEENLKQNGHEQVEVDGQLSKAEQQALSQFQQEHNIEARGQLDVETIKKMGIEQTAEIPELPSADQAPKSQNQ